ncbi:molecular chaperone DnaJ [Sphingomicrobium sediminis]|uniref:Chaperone protein DnaJ n=1 Tax=Sphingomicrobium sediminis TaxID=2950949 RepID=A0A9X2J3G0_9SPHN|nr:molecular chaperone DnaJ [Sphingomicrobium sediminis]MCM8557261.1 molecular chaperone DnaJ [Sphingomicrobium sediminis]
MADTDYYELLGVDRGADADTIKRAYRKAAMDCHPDRHNGCSDQEARFKSINEAYDVLKDPQKRAAYDRFGKAAFENGGGGGGPFGGGGGSGDFSDIFSSIFGDFMDGAARGGGGARRPAPGRGSDLRYDLELSLEEAFSGIEKTITVEALADCEPCEGNGSEGTSKPVVCETCGGAGKVRAQQGFFLVERGCPNCMGSGQVVADPCGHCNGEGRVLKKRKLEVKIPAGVDEGTRIRVAQEGEAGVRGAPAGDLYLFVHMKRHPIFQREGSTLIAEVPVSFTTAALGGEVEVPGVDGEKVNFKIAPGIQSGEALHQRGAGMNVVNQRGRGDMIVRVHVETPSKLSKKQKELLKAFRETETGDECPATKSFFGRIKDLFEG